MEISAWVDILGRLRGELSYNSRTSKGMLLPGTIDHVTALGSVSSGLADLPWPHDMNSQIECQIAMKHHWARCDTSIHLLQAVGDYSEICSRGLLVRKCSKHAASLRNLRVGIEIEFAMGPASLFQHQRVQWLGISSLLALHNDQTQNLWRSFTKGHHLIMNSEVELDSYEISLPPLDPVEACDAAVIARTLLEGDVLSNGGSNQVRFQPYLQDSGSSHALQLNISCDNLASIEIANAVQRYLAARSREAMPLTLLDKYSKMRLTQGTYAPKFLICDQDHRQGLTRIKQSDGRIVLEFRLPGSNCNPYLILAWLIEVISEALDQDLSEQPVELSNRSKPEIDFEPSIAEIESLKNILGAPVVNHLAAVLLADLEVAA